LCDLRIDLRKLLGIGRPIDRRKFDLHQDNIDAALLGRRNDDTKILLHCRSIEAPYPVCPAHYKKQKICIGDAQDVFYLARKVVCRAAWLAGVPD
jgi:hypothetical protein